MFSTRKSIAAASSANIRSPFSLHPPGGIDKLTGEQQEVQEMEDPELVAARLEQQRRRQEKHRKMEAEREKMRQNIRDKYKLKKKDNGVEEIAGRITSQRKTPEQVAMESQMEDDGILAQLGLAEPYERAKNVVTGALTAAKGYLPFGFSK